MADVQSQLEANGLPTKFASTAEKLTTDPIAADTTAPVMSNGQTPALSGAKQSGEIPPLAASTLIEPIEPTNVDHATASNPLPTTNGNSTAFDAESAPHVNGHATVGHIVQAAASPVPPPAPSPPQATSFTDSMVPSSIPSEIPSSNPTLDAADPPSVPVLEPIISPEQAPLSALRTSPHADNLAPETVALIEERKHEEDNNAHRAPSTTLDEPSPRSVPATTQPASAIGLPSPPTQSSPPPAPVMSHAPLPHEKLEVPATDIPAPVPAEPPAESAPGPAVSAPPVEDTVMAEAPAPEVAYPPKVSREREEDVDEPEPAGKRLKTVEGPAPAPEPSEFKVPEPPSATTTAATAVTPVEPSRKINLDGDEGVTASRLAHMKKVVSNLKKSKASAAFRLPVDYVALNIPTYPEVVQHPMDLGTIDNKLKKNEYTSVQDFVTDFDRIVHNCVLFNGRDHGVTQAALSMQSSFNSQMSNLPAATEVEPSKAEKKAMKLKTEPIRTAPPRRPSVTTPGAARSPKSAVTATTPSFAPGPDGIPLIRRDSNMVDGRPKRAIVPPKRNSDFAGVRPKKKKYELQLKFCHDVLKDIASPKHWQLNQYFTHPVDPVALNIPTYFQVIKKPMDLGTVQQKLDNNVYEKAKDFEDDVRLVFRNCYKFNPEGDYVNQLGHQLEALFDARWAEKDEWIAAREPPSEPPSDDEEDAEASDDEEPDSEDDRNEKIKLLQAQIEAMSRQMGELTQSKKKKKVSPPVDKKKSKAKPKKDKVAAQFPGLSKAKDKKKSTPKSKADKDRYVTFQEKQYISNGIAMLPEKQMQEALRIIQTSVPALANSNENEIELDIEEVPNHALLKLLAFVRKYAPLPSDEPAVHPESYSSAPSKSKKNKPMSKTEQEAQIEELKGRLGAYDGPVSPDAVQSVETGNDSSDDSADSEESEEE